jgi:hypothetical protein
VLGARYPRLSARSVRRTRNRPVQRTIFETDYVGKPAARISSINSRVRPGSRSPRSSWRVEDVFVTNHGMSFLSKAAAAVAGLERL